MDHLAILTKKRKLLSKIISGEKTIESRWYKFKRTPYRNISAGETVYFKESGEPVTVKARVEKALFFDNLTPKRIQKIIDDYGLRIGINSSYLEKAKDKHFCTLIFLKNVRKIEPFTINKKGYGIMNAWITLKNINALKQTRKP